MRFSKSCVALLFLITVSAQAQDTTVSSLQRNTDSVFHADKKTSFEWREQTIPDSTLQRLRADDAFWYANADLKKKKDVETNDASFWQWLFRQKWLYNLLWTIIIVSFVAVLLLFLMKSNIVFFQKQAKAIGGSSVTPSTEDLFSINYERAINDALAVADYPSAIRWHYLQTLALLHRKKLIEYNEAFTNSDYLQQLRQTHYYKDFKMLTRHFEYAWYGKFAITQQKYQAVAQHFATLKQSMGS